ncbi:n-acetylglutamate synthase [Joostella atrarenae]|uniref:N-acetylglutamate synthase n=1 Tax=Joostella atrarenae TaxID=679257 RepID=A0ABS9J634_9FLAO|nr:n-acetylglutamate synthase [Joostella atrarenae]MCF8715850.1 n-acetylglutamate synthase [Joostella atrarenae]
MKRLSYNNKVFRAVANSENGQTSQETLFYYKQEGNIITAEYNGGCIIKGHLIGIVDAENKIDMRYHQVDENNIIRTGSCISTPKVLKNEKIRLHEVWEWTSGDFSSGTSMIEEV